MLYRELRELEDCNQCTLLGEFCTGGMQSDVRGNPVEPPCTMLNDNDDMDDVYLSLLGRRLEFEDAEDRRYAAEQAKKAKNKVQAERRRESARAVRTETLAIKRLRKRIQALRAHDNFRLTFKIVDSMMSGGTSCAGAGDDEITLAMKQEVTQIELQIADLEKIKKAKLADLRKQRKEK